MRIQYINRKFGTKATALIGMANNILLEMYQDGYTLTLRQLYYQFVARDLIANTLQSYKRLGNTISEARLAGLIDWEHMEDRTRELREYTIRTDPAEAIQVAVDEYSLDKWEGQDNRVEVWVEKDALIGVVERASGAFQVPFFSCRGYVSQSAMWAAAQRLNGHIENERYVTILHLGDHDPSGVDMTRDIEDRLRLLCDYGPNDFEVKRIALTMDQIKKYDPPPNYAKLTDSRGKAYVKKYGKYAWELDALSPKVMVDLIKSHVKPLIEKEPWNKRYQQEEDDIVILDAIAEKLGESTDEK